MEPIKANIGGRDFLLRVTGASFDLAEAAGVDTTLALNLGYNGFDDPSVADSFVAYAHLFCLAALQDQPGTTLGEIKALMDLRKMQNAYTPLAASLMRDPDAPEPEGKGKAGSP